MKRRVSDRGVGELVAAALVIVSVVILVLAIVFIYFRGVMSLTNLYSKVSKVVNYYTSRIYIFNIIVCKPLYFFVIFVVKVYF